MLRELDLVRVKRDLNDVVSEGELGTILIVYGCPAVAYEVEFKAYDLEEELDLGQKVLTVEAADLELVCSTGARLFE